jgi:hypothetical protein
LAICRSINPHEALIHLQTIKQTAPQGEFCIKIGGCVT